MSSATDEPQDSDSAPDPKSDPEYIRLRRDHVFLALIPLAFLLGLGGGYLAWGQAGTTSPSQDVSAAPASEMAASSAQATRIEVDPGGDPSLGPVDAPITIIEFSDFTCPFCQRWHQEVSHELFDSYPGQIHFVYKDFPIVGGGRAGFLGAQAAHCAEEQGAYWEYHDALFSGGYVLDSPGIDQAAVDLGLDLESFKECMVEARYANEIRDDFNYGVSLGVTSTPTFFINGIPLVGAQPLINFAEIIDGELGN
ncbi:MAG: DsbA family protein [Anaerolineales bacterium]